MRIQDPVWKECYIEMTIKDGMFNMSAAVRLTSLVEMYILGFIIMLVVIKIKRKYWPRLKEWYNRRK